MSTDPSTTSPDASAAPAPTDTLSSPVPAPETAPDLTTTPAPSDASSPAPAAPPAQVPGPIAILTTEDSEGFLIETPCLVLDTFEHDDAEGNQATFANVVALPQAVAVKVDRLSSPS